MGYKVLVLVHSDLVPPAGEKVKKDQRDGIEWITEYDVITTLESMEHEIKTVGVYSDLKVIRDAIEEFKPHIVFNLLEEFNGQVLMDQNVVSYLELLGIAYTGCNPRGLMLARDKALAKKILIYHDIPTPNFQVFPKNKKPAPDSNLNYPRIVKCQVEEASLGISQASIVSSEEKLIERVNFLIDTYKTDVISEEFIEGREFYVGVLGNYQLKTLPVWELSFNNADNPEKEIYSRNAKWNPKYRKRKGIKTGTAKISDELQNKIEDICKRTYRALDLNGYARIDLRVDNEDNVFVIEANPNPNIALDDEFASSAKKADASYEELLQKIITLGISWSQME
jgi:D-alanine-D-alanine ligase